MPPDPPPSESASRRPCKSCGQPVSRYEDVCPACGRELPGIHATCPRCGSLHVDVRNGPPLAGRPPGREPIEAACRDCGLVWKPTMDEVLDATFDEGEERERAEFRDLVEHQAEQMLESASPTPPAPDPPPRRATGSGCGGCVGSVLILAGIVTAFGEPFMGISMMVLGGAIARRAR